MLTYIIANSKKGKNKKFNVKWALPLKDFEIEVNKENKVYGYL